MNQQVVEGIVLHAFDFKERSRIVTLFTPNLGKMNLIVNRISSKKPVLVNLTTPFCQAEFIYHKGKSDLYRFIDGSIINLHLPLRSSYTILNYGAKMLRIIAQSQFPGKPAKALYQLLIVYLKRMQKNLFP